MIDTNELRQSLGAIQTEEVAELLDRLEAAEGDIALKESIIDSLGSTLNAVATERDKLKELNSALHTNSNSQVIHNARLAEENYALRAKIEAMEKQGPVAVDINAFRSAFEAALKDRNWPATRQEDGYLSPSTQSAWRIAFSTVRRLQLYLAPGAQPAPSALAEAIIADMQAQHDSELITENDSGEALIRLDGAIAAVEDNFAQPAPSIPEGWKPIPEKHPTFDLVDLRLADGSVLCGCVPQSDGDYWWEGPSGEVFIDPKYAPATHWRLAAAPEAKP